MSRSNPNANAPNPATRWFEWSGETGSVRYFDKELKENIICPLPFTFLLLDELSSVRGWHEASKSGITSNQVRDTREELLVVRAFKAGTLAEGLYKDIKDRAARVGGKFVTNCYLGFKQGEKLAMGCLQFKGAALGAWMEFRKEHRRELFEQAVVITGSTEGKKGRIVYKMPAFKLTTLTPATNQQALDLDKQLQAYLTEYLSRTTHDRVDAPTSDAPDEEPEDNTPVPDDDLSDVPF
jgi:hypothetical protein